MIPTQVLAVECPRGTRKGETLYRKTYYLRGGKNSQWEKCYGRNGSAVFTSSYFPADDPFTCGEHKAHLMYSRKSCYDERYVNCMEISVMSRDGRTHIPFRAPHADIVSNGYPFEGKKIKTPFLFCADIIPKKSASRAEDGKKYVLMRQQGFSSSSNSLDICEKIKKKSGRIFRSLDTITVFKNTNYPDYIFEVLHDDKTIQKCDSIDL